MAIFSKLIDGVLFKGGILAAGVISMCLTKWEILPRYILPLSYGMTSLGILGLFVGYTDIVEDDDDPNYKQRMEEFKILKPMLEKKLKEQLELSIDYERLRARWKAIDSLERESIQFGVAIVDYEKKVAEGTIVQNAPVEGKSQRRKHRSLRDGEKRYPDIRFRIKRSLSWHEKHTDNESVYLTWHQE